MAEVSKMLVLGLQGPTQLRWEPFIAKLEAASEGGDADFIAANLPRLEQAIAELMDYQHKLAEPQYRARSGRERHEPGKA